MGPILIVNFLKNCLSQTLQLTQDKYMRALCPYATQYYRFSIYITVEYNSILNTIQWREC